MPAPQPQREPSVSEIKNELQAALNSRVFRQSKGLAKLLRYLCGAALLDAPEQLGEYAIATEALGKPPEFKDTKDASVRVELHRLRKRLAQFYEEEGAERPLRIVIPTGSYAPRFVYAGTPEPPAEPDALPLPPEEDAAPLEAEPAPDPPVQPPAPGRFRRLRWPLLAAAGVAAAAAVGWLALRPSETPLDRFWAPVISAPGEAILCVGNQEGGERPPTPPPSLDYQALSLLGFHSLSSQMMLVNDGVALAHIAGLLRAKGKPYRVLSQSESTFRDLQSGPVVLIGLRNNDWTQRTTGKLRFSVEANGPGRLRIRDREHPENAAWQTDFNAPYLSLTRDYALAVRVLDPKTESIVVAVGGISMFGTLAAAELLTDAGEMRKLEAAAPRGWKGQNVEAVVATEVIEGKSGHPQVLATRFW